jgi:hypothetical protein
MSHRKVRNRLTGSRFRPLRRRPGSEHQQIDVRARVQLAAPVAADRDQRELPGQLSPACMRQARTRATSMSRARSRDQVLDRTSSESRFHALPELAIAGQRLAKLPDGLAARAFAGSSGSDAAPGGQAPDRAGSLRAALSCGALRCAAGAEREHLVAVLGDQQVCSHCAESE